MWLQLEMICLIRGLYKLFFFLVFLLIIFFPTESTALFEEVAQSVSEARLLSSVDGVGNEKVIWIGLDIHLDSGWKTYWRTPGAAGYGLKIDWTGSQNLSTSEILWPTPSKFQSFNRIVNGYEDHVLFPLKVTLKNSHAPLLLHGYLNYLACDQANCIPQNKSVTLYVPLGPSAPSPDASAIEATLHHVPHKNVPFLNIQSAYFIPKDSPPSYLRITVFHENPLISPLLFIEGNNNNFFGEITNIENNNKNGNLSTLEVPVYKSTTNNIVRTPNLIGQSLTFTLKSGESSIETTLPIEAMPASIEETMTMFSFAILGGFILNFMPCVLPVILIKVFSLSRSREESTQAIRKSFFASVLGIISSFFLLALIPISFGFFGKSFGWGMQFQEPLFLIFMMIVLTLFTANFWGFYEIILPTRMTDMGYNYSLKEGYMGHFLTGAFATLLATPCSAPFLGIAVTFALSRSSFEILLMFMGLGMGLSLPFILIMIFPQIASLLPKPGKWMIYLKHVMGWGFFITMIWLFFVLKSQVLGVNAMLVLSMMLCMLVVFWLLKKNPQYKRKCISLILILIVTSFTSFFINFKPENHNISPHETMAEKIKEIKMNLQQNKVVLVDVTADWCLTCKTNELLVLDNKKVKDFIKKNNAVLIKVDWTSEDPDVYEYIKSFNRNGIPFYAVYGPSLPYGKVLPQIITFSIVEHAILDAKQKI